MKPHQHGWLFRWPVATALLAAVPLALAAGCGAPAVNTGSATPGQPAPGVAGPAATDALPATAMCRWWLRKPSGGPRVGGLRAVGLLLHVDVP